MDVFELRDPEQATNYVVQSCWLSRSVSPSSETTPAALDWAFELAGEGVPLPPVGFVSDVGHIALGAFREAEAHVHEGVPGFDSALLRKYEDYVLGKLYADTTFERGADALLRYSGRKRVRGLAFLVEQFRQRAGFGGVILSPGVIKALQSRDPDEVLAQGWESLQQEGAAPQLVAQFEALIAAVHDTGDVLGSEDVFELERGTALHKFGQRLALRQVLQAAARLGDSLPHRKLKPVSRRQQVATRILDEDFYPVGGFSSLSTRGSVESLLHSQLAYMERQERPDLFDIKFLRDELLYYSRDENQFLRRRRTFVFAFYPGLAVARVKDPELPWQRIILLLGLLYAATRKLIDWLSDEALTFAFLFPRQEGAAQGPLHDERTLVATLLREQIENGTVLIGEATSNELAGQCDAWARRSLCHCLAIDTCDQQVPCEVADLARLRVCEHVPALGIGDQEPARPEQDGVDGWCETLYRLLEAWMR